MKKLSLILLCILHCAFCIDLMAQMYVYRNGEIIWQCDPMTIDSVAFRAPMFTITATANDATMGSVTGGGEYAYGTEATLTAVANVGYEFVQWQNGQTEATIVVSVFGHASYMAYFKPASSGEGSATQLTDLVEAYYSSEFISGVSNDYWCSFITEDIVIDAEGNPMGTGEFVYIEIFPAIVNNNFPAGGYAFAEEPTDGYAWAGWEWDFGADMGYEEGIYLIPQGSFAYVIEDDDLVATKYMLSGSVKISGTPEEAELFVDATFADGSRSTYYYKGKLAFEDYDNPGGNGGGDEEELSWDYEPTTAGEYTATFDYCEMNNWGDYYGDGTEYVDLTLNGTEWYAIFGLCAPLGSGVEAYGTYTVKDGYTDWTAVPSPGGDNEYDYASFVATGMNESGAYSIAYYVASGTVVVAADGIKFDIVSHYGSKIKGEYKGDVVVADKSAGYNYAPAQSKENQPRKMIKLVKASVEDMAYFGTLKNRAHK